jgi:tRNA1Val (adenine37-N6)-methyltransferase
VSAEGVTLDRFLGGRILAAQPSSGFRAGHDTILLAAAVPADNDSLVLELGSGAGIASLCLAVRVPGARIVGIEIDPELVRLANDNAARNTVTDRVSFVIGDASTPASQLDLPPPRGEVGASHRAKRDGAPGGGPFDHVFFNPPFHPDSAHSSPVPARDRATRDSSDAVRTWTERAISLVRDGGTVTAIIRADRIDDVLSVARDHSGIIFPLFPRAGATPKRAIIHIIKTERGSPITLPSPLEGEGGAKRRKGGDTQNNEHFNTAAGLVLHESGGRNTEAAEAILRHGQALNLSP